jgi:hypothetical protein
LKIFYITYSTPEKEAYKFSEIIDKLNIKIIEKEL